MAKTNTEKTQKTPKNQKERLLAALQSGNSFTTNQIANRLGVSNSRARFLITELRQDGYAVYRNRKKLSTGEKAVKYRLGTPSRRMVSIAAYYAGGQIFG